MYSVKTAKYPHDMFKGNIKKVAKTPAEHMKLQMMGYSHKKPKK
jgi:hypothetical protein